VDEKVLRKHGARYLVDSYDSRHQMFVTLYPEHPWEIQRFPQASIDWNNKNNLFDAMDKAEKLIGITKVKITFFLDFFLVVFSLFNLDFSLVSLSLSLCHFSHSPTSLRTGTR